jgi:hypothetical protein
MLKRLKIEAANDPKLAVLFKEPRPIEDKYQELKTMLSDVQSPSGDRSEKLLEWAIAIEEIRLDKELTNLSKAARTLAKKSKALGY